MTDDGALQQAYEELLTARAPADRARCPSPEALLALVERQASEDARLTTLDHVMSCAACRRELDLLRVAVAAANAAGSSGADSTRSVQRGIPRIPLRPLALAAGIVVVIGVGVVSRERYAPGTSVLRSGASTGALLVPVRQPDGGVLLRWRAVDDAPRYRVEVFTSSGASVVELVVVDTSLVVSSMTFRGRTDTLRWTVTALRTDGGELRSPMGRISP